MTLTTPSVDGVSLRPRIRLEPDAFDIASDHARTRGTTITEAVNEMLRSFAPPVEQGSRPPAPEDGREGSEEPPASLPSVLSPPTLEESKALHPSSRPVVEYVKGCPYCGERSSHGRCS